MSGLNIFRADLKMARGAKFILAVVGIPCFILFDSATDLQDLFHDVDVSVHYFYANSITFGGLFGRYLVGMLCALPYATAFLQEYDAGMTPAVMVRCGGRSYFTSKFCACWLTGGAVNLLGQALLLLGLSTLEPLFTQELLDRMSGFYYFSLAEDMPVMYFAVALYYAFLTGALMAGLAMWVSAFVMSRYAVLVVPAIVLFMHIQVNQIFQIPVQWQINLWLSMRVCLGSELLTVLLSFAFVSCVLLLCGMSFVHRGRRVMRFA